MAVARHLLRGAQALAVQEQLDPLGVAVDPDIDRLPLLARPVPVRQQVGNGLIAPPGPVIVVAVLGEAADVQDAEVRVDAGPAVRRRLAFVVETGPDEAAGDERALGDGPPRPFRRLPPGRAVDIIGADVTLLRIVRVLAAR